MAQSTVITQTPKHLDTPAVEKHGGDMRSPSRERVTPSTPRRPRREPTTPNPSQDAELKNYQLGDCLGKGAFGSVYRALNMETGETVAVKQIKLADLPKSELRVITLEIDLLKNLDHPNIVKYHGFVKSAETLNIILEYCENGSLHSISKNFGKFPENLVGLYMSQVLHGLLYLHEQGVIHRDIKGANILTTKQGLVKLADFGVATRTTGLNDDTVVGTPYWMAPEVIEMTGATTASDIWSLGCTVIELLDGRPPYHKLQQMQALFRIVNDDHPPLPESASPVVRDFLMQCFQKDPNLRVSARKLLKHPWIAKAKKSDTTVPKKLEHNETIQSVQQYNEALKSPNSTSRRKVSRPMLSSPIPPRRERPSALITPARGQLDLGNPQRFAEKYRSPAYTGEDVWDDDFASAISPSALQLPHLRPQDHFGGMLSSEKLKAYASFETVTEESNWDDNFEGDLTVRSPIQPQHSDALETIRQKRANTNVRKQSTPTKPPKAQPDRISSRHSTSKPAVFVKPPKPKPVAVPRPTLLYRESSIEDYSDLIPESDDAFEIKLALNKKKDPTSPKLYHPSDLRSLSRASLASPKIGGSLHRQSSQLRKPSMRRTRSSVEIQRYADNEQDEDFSDIFGKEGKEESEKGSDSGTLKLNSKLSNHSWLGDDDDEDDPFAQFEEGFGETDLEANVARDKYARLCTQVEGLVASLKGSQAEDALADLSYQLLEVLSDLPETKSVIISAHGMLPILEILENCRNRDIILNLLKIVNLIILDNVEIQENLCFVGGIPIITKYASKKQTGEIRREAAEFVRQMFQTSTMTLQMFVSSGGLKVLVEFLEEDYEEERDLVSIGVDGVWSVFECQGPTPKNDFCRILSRSSVLDPLSLVLSRVLDEKNEHNEECENRIAKISKIFFLFSQAENYVKELVAERTVLHRVLKDLKRMSPTHQITMLKFIKNLSMLSTTLDSLQNSNAIDVLTDLLNSSFNKKQFREIANQVLNTIYNLCRLNKSRQEDAALNGIIPILQRIFKTEKLLKEFALPILCDMAHSGKVGRRELWRNKGLPFYISLLAEPYWQVPALDAIFIWLQEETAKVEDHLLNSSFSNALINYFGTSKSSGFEGLLEPLQKLLRLSPPIALTLAHPEFFSRVSAKLQSSKAFVRLNILRIVRSICDASDEQGALINIYGLYDAIQKLAEYDGAVLVRNMAGKLIKSCDEQDKVGKSGGKRRQGARRTSSSITPPSASQHGNSPSMPPTPTSTRSSQIRSTALQDVRSNNLSPDKDEWNSSTILNSRTSFRIPPKNDDDTRSSSPSSITNATRSRLPLRPSGRTSRQSLVASPRKLENILPSMEGRSSVSTSSSSSTASASNQRRRRQLGSDVRSGWT
ncbi:MAG: hypothetical protein MMC33_000964 [Icmadophila ericetorum]|nr:hypothetical protein [Icmadophila ericetorum]